MPELTGKEIRTAIRDRIGVLLSKQPCPAAIQILELYDEFFPPEESEHYLEAYQAASGLFESPIDFMTGVAFERLFGAIECCMGEDEDE
jgi:hypothetical protein